MNNVKSILPLVLAGMSGSLSAGYAEDDWPEPVKLYHTGQVLFDRLEVARTDNHESLMVWDMLAWYGGDRNRI